MHIVITGFTVADYCRAMERREIVVNKEYQRSDKVWPAAAKAYLIETILLGYPIPKLYLHQVTNVKTRKTHKEIVDGQQRSQAVLEFFQDKLRLSHRLETDEIAGKKYSELEREYQQRFLDYQLTTDLFVAATPEEVREVFRRMNSYTIPLNPEEQRHAIFQGLFKWFIHRLGRRFSESFVAIGLFGERQLVRMADTKLLSEIIHALVHGIQTTHKSKLYALYAQRETEFPEETVFEQRMSRAFDQLIEWEALHRGPLMRPHIVYALILATIHIRESVDTLESLFPSPGLQQFDRERVVANLTALGAALDQPEIDPRFAEFVDSCSERTNVREQRERRFTWLCRALSTAM